MNMLAPTFINNRQGSSKSRGGGSLTSLTGDVKMGEVADVVAGALRCICDVNVDGRYCHCDVKDDQSADLARSCVVLCQRRRRISR